MDAFVRLPRELYKNSRKYVPDMDSDIRDFFKKRKNGSLKNADVQAFVAYMDGECVGRITALVSYKANERWKKNQVRFTHIEFIDDIRVSRALIRAVEVYGRERGMDEIEGPMGITDFDKEGMLIEDFELAGSFMEHWNYPYYPKHMEELGFTKAADWLQVRVKVPEEVPPRYARVAKLSREMFGLRVIKLSKRKVFGKWGVKIFELINEAYSPLFGFSPFDKKQIKDLLKQYVPLLDMSIVPCVVNEKNELVSIAITIADISWGLRKSEGKLLPFGWWHLLKALTWQKSKKAQLMIIAVRPDFQGLGVNAMIFDDLIPIYNRKGIEWCETGPQLEDNVKELTQWKPLNPTLVKRRRCWTKKVEQEV